MTVAREGKFIVFEGIDGTGKTTQLALLAAVLENRGLAVVATREPTAGTYGLKIRELYTNRESVSRRQELDLFLADRREHVREVVQPALQAGRIVLCDRYILSTVAYQGAAGFSIQELFALNAFAPDPDLALLFQASPGIGLARITGTRGENPNDFERAEGLDRVAEIFAALDRPYIRRIDASLDIATVHVSVLQAVEPLFSPTSSR